MANGVAVVAAIVASELAFRVVLHLGEQGKAWNGKNESGEGEQRFHVILLAAGDGRGDARPSRMDTGEAGKGYMSTERNCVLLLRLGRPWRIEPPERRLEPGLAAPLLHGDGYSVGGGPE